MEIPGFTQEALSEVEHLLYAERPNPYEGKCGQKKLREQNKTQRTPAQQEADRTRADALRGKSQSSTNRSEAAKKAAETRRKCKGSARPVAPAGVT
jgi:hypothetical protein